MKTYLKKGDLVKIINRGRIYMFYNSMFKKLGFKNTEENVMEERHLDDIWIVKEIVPHGSHLNTIVVFIENNKGEQLLIEDKGLERIDNSVEGVYEMLKFLYNQKDEHVTENLLYELKNYIDSKNGVKVKMYNKPNQWVEGEEPEPMKDENYDNY